MRAGIEGMTVAARAPLKLVFPVALKFAAGEAARRAPDLAPPGWSDWKYHEASRGRNVPK
jgi:hypothetical protein